MRISSSSLRRSSSSFVCASSPCPRRQRAQHPQPCAASHPRRGSTVPYCWPALTASVSLAAPPAGSAGIASSGLPVSTNSWSCASTALRWQVPPARPRPGSLCHATAAPPPAAPRSPPRRPAASGTGRVDAQPQDPQGPSSGLRPEWNWNAVGRRPGSGRPQRHSASGIAGGNALQVLAYRAGGLVALRGLFRQVLHDHRIQLRADQGLRREGGSGVS